MEKVVIKPHSNDKTITWQEVDKTQSTIVTVYKEESMIGVVVYDTWDEDFKMFTREDRDWAIDLVDLIDKYPKYIFKLLC